jgi:hypothetical protein
MDFCIAFRNDSKRSTPAYNPISNSPNLLGEARAGEEGSGPAGHGAGGLEMISTGAPMAAEARSNNSAWLRASRTALVAPRRRGLHEHYFEQIRLPATFSPIHDEP